MPTARNEATAAITASPKSSSAENAVKCSEGSIGTIVELNLSSGAASAGLNPLDWNATPEPSMSWSFKMLSSRQSIRCLETKVAIRHNYSSILPQSSELHRRPPLRTSTRSWWPYNRSLSRKPRAKKPMTRLPIKYSGFENCASRPPSIPLQEMSR